MREVACQCIRRATLVGFLGLLLVNGIYARSIRQEFCKKKAHKYYTDEHGCKDCDGCYPGQELNMTEEVPENSQHGALGCPSWCPWCPEGFYNDRKYTWEPCKSCTMNCSSYHRNEKQSCTRFHDAACGTCLYGYYDENKHSSIIPDVQRDLLMRCLPCRTGIVHEDCPTTTQTPSTLTVSTPTKPATPQTLSESTGSTPTKPEVFIWSTISPEMSTTKSTIIFAPPESRSSQTPWNIGFIALAVIVAIFILAVIVRKIIKRRLPDKTIKLPQDDTADPTKPLTNGTSSDEEIGQRENDAYFPSNKSLLVNRSNSWPAEYGNRSRESPVNGSSSEEDDVSWPSRDLSIDNDEQPVQRTQRKRLSSCPRYWSQDQQVSKQKINNRNDIDEVLRKYSITLEEPIKNDNSSAIRMEKEGNNCQWSKSNKQPDPVDLEIIKVTQDHMDFVSKYFGGGYRILGRQLGLKESTLDYIQRDYCSDGGQEVVVQVIRTWAESENCANVLFLCNTLQNIGKVDLSCKLRTYVLKDYAMEQS